MAYFQEIKRDLLMGKQFANELADWETQNDQNNDSFEIRIGAEFRSYLNITTYAKRVKQLINRGF